MSYVALYRKWRPLVFQDVVDQEHVVTTLKNSIKYNRIAHAYLFCGTRGTGKTTMAKIFSRAINCLNPIDSDPCNKCEICTGILSGQILDVIEIDAASNNSVDNIRNIRDEVIYSPSQAKYKVYIIDEVHMLSTGAFNALLKTLEEPPAHVIFILATTEPHKLPATILSRCQRYDFRRIGIDSIVKRLEKILNSNNIKFYGDALRLIARLSEGALRDAISILDQCISLGKDNITYDDVLSVVGIANDQFVSGIVDAMIEVDITKLLQMIDNLIMDGKDISKFVSDVIFYYRNLLIYKVCKKPNDVTDISKEIGEIMEIQAANIEQEKILFTIKELSQLEASLKWVNQPRVFLEVMLINICQYENNDSQDIQHTEIKVSRDKVAEKKEKEQKKEEKKKVVKKTIESLEPLEVWVYVLDKLKTMGKMAMFSNLIDSKLTKLNDSKYAIIFANDCEFKKMFVSKPENIEIIENILNQELGKSVRVVCINETDFEESCKSNDENYDSLVERARGLANKFDVPLNILED